MSRHSIPFSTSFENEGPEVVWYPVQSQDEWSACKVFKQPQSRDGPLTLLIKGTEVVVPPEHFDMVYPKMDALHLRPVNLVAMPATVEAIEEALRNHFCNTRPYTNINDVTLFVSLYRQIEPSIYSQHWIDQYSALNPELPPHIYAAAAKAYKELIDTQESQAIVLVGDTCTGKTSAMRHVLNFLIGTAGCDQDFDVQASALLNLVTPLVSISIDAQGGKCSWASTRAAVSVEFTIGGDGFMNRCFTKVDFLETERLSGPEDSPQMRFDALYLALKEPSASQWLAGCEEFAILGDFLDLPEYDKDGTAVASWFTAIDAFYLDKGVVVRVLCGILLLGNVHFEEDDEQGSRCSALNDLDLAATALGVDSAALVEALCRSTICRSRRRLRQFVQELYRRLVAWVLEQANRCLQTDSSPRGALIQVVEIPARPLAHHSPSGLDSLLLQWLNENVRATMPLAVNKMSKAGAMTSGVTCQNLVAALQQHKGDHRGDLEDVVLEAFMDEWANHPEQMSSGRIISCTPEHVVAIRGILGEEIQYRLNDEFLDSVRGIRLEAARRIFSHSTVGAVREFAEAGFDQSQEAGALAARVAEFTEVLGSEGVRPWLVCCLRPNTKMKSTLVSKVVLEKQVESLMLDHLVRLAGEADKEEAQVVAKCEANSPIQAKPSTPPGRVSTSSALTAIESSSTPAPRPPALSEADIQAALAHVDEFLPDLVCVCILGGTAFQDPSSQELVANLASHLSVACGHSVVFITGGMKGVQETFARHCQESCHLYHMLPEGESSGFEQGIDIHAGENLDERKEIFAQVGDIYITVEGGPGVAQEATTAFERGAKVVPLIRSGGASSGKFGFPVGALVRPRYIQEDQWQLLADKSAPVQMGARAATEIVEGLVRRFEEGEAAEADRAAEGRNEDEGPSWSTSTVDSSGLAPKAPVVAIPAGQGIKESVAAVKRCLPSLVRICILGSTAFQDPNSEELVKQIAVYLTHRVFKNAVFITGGLKGVQETFARHCDRSARLYHMLPQGQSSGFDYGTDINAGADMDERKQIFAQVGDIYVTVEGGPGVAMEAGIAFQNGAEVMPIIRTGGASCGMFDFPPAALVKPSFVPEATWQAMVNKEASMHKTVLAATEMVQGYIGRVEEKRAGSSSKSSGKVSFEEAADRHGHPPAKDLRSLPLPDADDLSDLQDSGDSDHEQKDTLAAGVSFLHNKTARPRLCTMAFHEHARMHYALSQMAAELRTAKKREAGHRAEFEANKMKLERLRAERDAWTQETKHLEGHVKYLNELKNKPLKVRAQAADGA